MEQTNLTFREQLIMMMLEDTLKQINVTAITRSRILTIHRIADELSNRPETTEIQRDDTITMKPISEIGMHSQAHSALFRFGIRTIGDLLQMRPKDILRIHGFGRKALTQIEDYLEENGLEFENR